MTHEPAYRRKYRERQSYIVNASIGSFAAWCAHCQIAKARANLRFAEMDRRNERNERSKR